jgi:hypothetical protein
LDSSTLSTTIQSFVVANPLTPIVDAYLNPFPPKHHPTLLTGMLRSFLDASTYFPFFDRIAGPLAGPRAIQMQIRKYSTMDAYCTFAYNNEFSTEFNTSNFLVIHSPEPHL